MSSKFKPPVVNVLPVPSLSYPGAPAVTGKQNFALQAEYFLVKALDRAAWTYRDEYQQLTAVMNSIQKEIATEGLATAEGISELAKFVFEDAFVREFIQTVNLNFFTMFSEWHNPWREFISNIALGLTMAPVVKHETQLGPCDIPADLQTRKYSHEYMFNWLLANNWAVIVIMLKMWGTLPDAAN